MYVSVAGFATDLPPPNPHVGAIICYITTTELGDDYTLTGNSVDIMSGLMEGTLQFPIEIVADTSIC